MKNRLIVFNIPIKLTKNVSLRQLNGFINLIENYDYILNFFELDKILKSLSNFHKSVSRKDKMRLIYKKKV